MGIITYLQSIRLNQAVGLLEDLDKDLDEVAQEAGFINARSMQRAFKEKYSMTPGQYRRMQAKRKK